MAPIRIESIVVSECDEFNPHKLYTVRAFHLSDPTKSAFGSKPFSKRADAEDCASVKAELSAKFSRVVIEQSRSAGWL